MIWKWFQIIIIYEHLYRNDLRVQGCLVNLCHLNKWLGIGLASERYLSNWWFKGIVAELRSFTWNYEKILE